MLEVSSEHMAKYSRPASRSQENGPGCDKKTGGWLGQVFGGPWMGIVAWAADPKRVVVELNPLDVRLAERHGAQPSISHRQGLGPSLGRPVAPERHLPRFGAGDDAETQDD